MSDIRFIAKEGAPDERDKEVLVRGLLAHHAIQGHQRKSELYSIFMRDEADVVCGGVIVSYLWNGMEILSIWVDNEHRKKGYGQKLMKMVEEEAAKRGCTIAYTNTFPWQAPEFYQKLGYMEYGKLEGFPDGHSLHYFCKKLT